MYFPIYIHKHFYTTSATTKKVPAYSFSCKNIWFFIFFFYLLLICLIISFFFCNTILIKSIIFIEIFQNKIILAIFFYFFIILQMHYWLIHEHSIMNFSRHVLLNTLFFIVQLIILFYQYKKTSILTFEFSKNIKKITYLNKYIAFVTNPDNLFKLKKVISQRLDR